MASAMPCICYCRELRLFATAKALVGYVVRLNRCDLARMGCSRKLIHSKSVAARRCHEPN
jgi:hypothetical protein